MKKRYIFMALAAVLMMVSCGNEKDTFQFKGTVHGYVDCTLATASISEMDFGYIVALSTPDSIGADYTNGDGEKFKNCVVLYRTKTRLRDGDEISGKMYLDDQYSRAYCSFHTNKTLPEGVCYVLD